MIASPIENHLPAKRRGGYIRYEWDYFELDKKGVVVRSPHGLAKEFNRKIQITDIEKAVEDYKFVKINH